jgi:hypothetical protein
MFRCMAATMAAGRAEALNSRGVLRGRLTLGGADPGLFPPVWAGVLPVQRMASAGLVSRYGQSAQPNG